MAQPILHYHRLRRWFFNGIKYNVAFIGGGIYLGSGDPLVRSNIIALNESTYSGNGGAGGVYLFWGSDPIISNNLICFNTASGYGAAVSLDSSDPILSNNTLPGIQVEFIVMEMPILFSITLFCLGITVWRFILIQKIVTLTFIIAMWREALALLC